MVAEFVVGGELVVLVDVGFELVDKLECEDVGPCDHEDDLLLVDMVLDFVEKGFHVVLEDEDDFLLVGRMEDENVGVFDVVVVELVTFQLRELEDFGFEDVDVDVTFELVVFGGGGTELVDEDLELV